MRVRPRFWRCCVLVAIGDVRHRILHAVVEPRGAHREVLDRRHVHAQLATDQPLGPELIVGQRQDGADAELAIQLVERRRAEARAEAAPRRHLVGHVVQRRDARAEHRVVAFGQRRGWPPSAGPWRPSSRGCARCSCASGRRGRSRVTDSFGTGQTWPARTRRCSAACRPASRSSVTVVPVAASRPCSRLSPSTRRQSRPAERRCVATIRPWTTAPSRRCRRSGTSCSSVMRPTARGVSVGAGPAATAMKLLWKVSTSPKTRACRSLWSGSVARTPPFSDFHCVSLASRRRPERGDLAVVAFLLEVAAADEDAHALASGCSRASA